MSNETMTEFELLKMENFALKNSVLQANVQANVQQREAFIRQMLADRPGYDWDERLGSLVRVAASPKEE